jgi:hypothetical protein
VILQGELLLGWRDGAWVNGQLLITSGGGLLVKTTIKTLALTVAQTYKLPRLSAAQVWITCYFIIIIIVMQQQQ